MNPEELMREALEAMESLAKQINDHNTTEGEK